MARISNINFLLQCLHYGRDIAGSLHSVAGVDSFIFLFFSALARKDVWPENDLHLLSREVVSKSRCSAAVIDEIKISNIFFGQSHQVVIGFFLQKPGIGRESSHL